MDIRLPRLGEGADSGSVVSVLVKVGDRVKKNQPVVELENEKAVAAIPSTADGTVTKVYVKPGDKISVGQALVALDNGGAAASSAEPAPARQAHHAPSAAPVRTPEPLPEPAPGGPVAAAPSIRKLARELGIDLSRIRGSERGGRIILEDVRAYIQRLQQQASHPAGGAQAAKPPAERIDFSKWGPVTATPMTPLRQTVSQRMSASWTTVPHVTQFDEVDVTDLLALKKKYDAAYEKKGTKLTLTAFFLRALASTLKAHPKFNCSIDEAAHAIVQKHYYHLGIAVDTEAGLMVPVIRDVDKKTLFAVSKELNELAEKARQRKVTGEDLQGGTFTISNQGGIGGAHFTTIVKLPEVAILGIGQGRCKPVVRDNALVKAAGALETTVTVHPRTMVPLSLSYDHRVIDGADAARFIKALVGAMEGFKEADVKLGK